MSPHASRQARKRALSSSGEGPPSKDALKQLDEDLLVFQKLCEKAAFTEAEMREICEPLVTAIRRSQMMSTFKWLAGSLSILAFLCLLSQSGTVQLHFTAVARILMIKALPLWDWSHLFYERCLVNNPYYVEPSVTQEDCVACESLEEIDRLTRVSYEQVQDGYLQRDAPFIVQDAMDSWPVMNTNDFWFDNITQVYLQDERLYDTVPCAMSTNLRTSSSDLLAFLKKVQNPELDKWFVHWQNCDLNAMKALRRFYQRPYFLANSVSPAHFNWVLMSSDYNTKIFKKIELDTGLIQLAQLRGSTSFRLVPHEACNASCSALTGELREGEILVLTNYIWGLEYVPGRGLDNVAILTETVWED